MRLTTKFGNTPKDQRTEYNSRHGGEMFVSYGTNIALKSNGCIFLDENYWDYSATTGYYRNQFLGEGIADTRKGIEDGTYILTNLN